MARVFVVYESLNSVPEGLSLGMWLAFVGADVVGEAPAFQQSVILPTNAPGTWDSLIRDHIYLCASERGWSVTDSTIHLPQYNKAGQAVSWTKDRTFTNIPAALTNVYPALGGEQQLVNFNGYTEYRFSYQANKIGNTGVHYAALVDGSNPANYIELADLTAATGEHAMDSGWLALPAWAIGERSLKPMARDPLATGDDVYHGFQLYLR